MQSKALIILILLAFLMLSGCLDRLKELESNNDTEYADSNVKYVEIYIDDYAFHPQFVTISRGDTVRWTNNDSVAYIIKSSSFQSPTLTKGMTFTYTFYERRTYNYYLATHPYTKSGTIVVE
ncbi:MAG: hypothetical protein H5T43_03950 [Methanomethylovorans sp.]|jgi:plastocyanin|nr:hypothetical protein [Methanomethylovorans sp.]